VVRVLQLPEVLAEVSPMVASSEIHPLVHSLTLRHLLPLLTQSNHRVLPLKQEQIVRRRATSLSPRLGTAPPLTVAPLTPTPPPPVQLIRTPPAHRHSLKTHFVARE
jgi:hypothetical protein